MLLFIFGIIGFLLLVVIHEMGHFIAARRNGVETEEFGIGFPPRAIGRKIRQKKGDQTIYSINWLPLGGFVKLKGEYSDCKDIGSFGAASFKNKTKILLAGVAMNFLAAWIILTILFIAGIPKINFEGLPFYNKSQYLVSSDVKVSSSSVILASIEQGGPADQAKLLPEDKIISINDLNISTEEELRAVNNSKQGQIVNYKISRSGQELTIPITLRQSNENKPLLGAGLASSSRISSTWSSPINAGLMIYQVTEVSLKGMGYAISNIFSGNEQKAADVVGGPVATVAAIKSTSHQGWREVLLLIALISISLGLMNILPIPALDGGRWFVLALFTYWRRPLKKELEEKIHGTGMLALIVLIIVISVVDIKRII